MEERCDPQRGRVRHTRERQGARAGTATEAWTSSYKFAKIRGSYSARRRYRLGVRTRGSQPRDRGSNPRTATISFINLLSTTAPRDRGAFFWYDSRVHDCGPGPVRSHACAPQCDAEPARSGPADL